MRESSIERKACGLVLNHLGVTSSKLVTPGQTGYPDRIFWLPGGSPFFIEYKKPGEESRPKQSHVQESLIKLGYKVEVHDNEIQTLQAIIDSVDSPSLPKESHEILDRARSICAVLRSRIR